ncbi:MAG: radical SAM protein [bacterium]
MNRPKLLLLHPPSERNVMRLGYCSQETKGGYFWADPALMAQSGILNARFETHFLDSVAEKLGPDATLKQIAAGRYDGILMMAGWASFGEDARFAEILSMRFPNARILSCGDVFRFHPEAFLARFPQFGAALVEWTSRETVKYFARENGPFKEILLPGEKYSAVSPGPFSYGLPDYSRINLRNYRLPFPDFRQVATVLASAGCPCKCDYCMMETAPLRPRDLGEVENELDYLAANGIKNIFFLDPMLNSSQERFSEFLKMMGGARRGMRFAGFFRADLLAAPDIVSLKRAGCAAMLIGIEHPDSGVLLEHARASDIEKMKAVIGKARECGIFTIGHFIARLSPQDGSSIKHEAEFIRECGTDFVSVNELVLRPGTTLFDRWLAETGRDVVDACLEARGRFPDGGGAFIATSPSVRSRALMRSHYMRLSSILRLSRFIASPGSWKDLATNILSLWGIHNN